VFGGYHYDSKQFTPANDAWRFDFGAATWKELTGSALSAYPGGRAAPIPGARAVLYFGGSAPLSSCRDAPTPARLRDLHRAHLEGVDVQLAFTEVDGTRAQTPRRRPWRRWRRYAAASGAACADEAVTRRRVQRDRHTLEGHRASQDFPRFVKPLMRSGDA